MGHVSLIFLCAYSNIALMVTVLGVDTKYLRVALLEISSFSVFEFVLLLDLLLLELCPFLPLLKLVFAIIGMISGLSRLDYSDANLVVSLQSCMVG